MQSLRLSLLLLIAATLVHAQENLLRLRSAPLALLNYYQAESLAVAKGFYDATWNMNAEGVKNKYEMRKFEAGEGIIDRATGLMWQQSGSAESMTHAQAWAYVASLNHAGHLGFHDWRLPTFEEAMTLLEKRKSQHKLHVDTSFDDRQVLIWTSDCNGPEVAWVVLFDFGAAYEYFNDVVAWVRAVRSVEENELK